MLSSINKPPLPPKPPVAQNQPVQRSPARPAPIVEMGDESSDTDSSDDDEDDTSTIADDEFNAMLDALQTHLEEVEVRSYMHLFGVITIVALPADIIC